MSDTKKLHATDVKNEVKRIKKLPKHEQEGQMDALYDKIKTEIDTYFDQIDKMNTSERDSEYIRVTDCVREHRWKWEKQLWYYIYDKKSESNKSEEREKCTDINASFYMMRKVITAHVSGLPLPEQAEVYIWWQDNKLYLLHQRQSFP